MKTAVITFPGSNCDRDMQVALREVFGSDPTPVWHRDTALPDGLDFIALPGGFSYGDVLGAGGGWAKSILFSEKLLAEFQHFFHRDDTSCFRSCNT